MPKSIPEILVETRHSKGFNKSEMARQLDIASQLYGQYERGEVAPKLAFRKKFEELFSISLMENEEKRATSAPKEKKEVIALGRVVPTRLTAEDYAAAYGDWLGVPMYNAPVTASFVESYTDKHVYKPQYYLHDPRFKDCAFGVVITGDSMHGEIRHGDYVACQEITDWRFIVYGDIYYIVTAEMQTCKYINADPHNPDNWLLVPHNKSISPSPIPKDMIKRLFKVRGVVRGY